MHRWYILFAFIIAISSLKGAENTNHKNSYKDKSLTTVFRETDNLIREAEAILPKSQNRGSISFEEYERLLNDVYDVEFKHQDKEGDLSSLSFSQHKSVQEPILQPSPKTEPAKEPVISTPAEQEISSSNKSPATSSETIQESNKLLSPSTSNNDIHSQDKQITPPSDTQKSPIPPIEQKTQDESSTQPQPSAKPHKKNAIIYSFYSYQLALSTIGIGMLYAIYQIARIATPKKIKRNIDLTTPSTDISAPVYTTS